MDQLGRKTPTATLLTPVVTVLPNLPDNLVNVTEITASINIRESIREEEDEHNCYVPTEHTFPNLIRRESGFERVSMEYTCITVYCLEEGGRKHDFQERQSDKCIQKNIENYIVCLVRYSIHIKFKYDRTLLEKKVLR